MLLLAPPKAVPAHTLDKDQPLGADVTIPGFSRPFQLAEVLGRSHELIVCSAYDSNATTPHHVATKKHIGKGLIT